MKEFTLEAKIEKITELTDAINEELEANDCPMKAQIAIDIAIDEIFSNIAMYGYAEEEGNATVQLEIEQEPPAAVLSFIDEAPQYNPLAKEDPDTTLSLDERGVGGLGIFMVKKSMDELDYRYENGRNIFTIKKLF